MADKIEHPTNDTPTIAAEESAKPQTQTDSALPSREPPPQTAGNSSATRYGPPRPGAPGPRGQRPFPRGERPKVDGSKPPELDKRDFAASRPNRRELDQSIEAELAAAMTGFDISGTMARSETVPSARTSAAAGSSRKTGTIVSIHGKDVFVNIPGARSQGVLPIQQFEGKSPKIGDPVEFEIERYDAANGLLLLTMEGAAQAVTDWSSVARGMVVEARVTGVNKNATGLLVEVNGIKGFMPASQIDLYRTDHLSALINQRLKCVVTEVDPSERNLLLSRRALLEREREQQREQFWTSIEEGQVRTGIVRAIKPFGVFVDLGGADGLIPVAELSWSRVTDPSELVQIGQKVEVVVNRLDRESRKIGLSLRATVRSPWAEFAETHKVGSRLRGTVTRITDFGAFVELAPGIEGLLHISELSTQRVRRVRDILQEGQSVEVELLSLDSEARRISLSLKSLQAEAQAAAEAEEEKQEADDRRQAEERISERPVNPNLRGGIGSQRIQFERGS